jgi:high affinity Mn2+ porin
MRELLSAGIALLALAGTASAADVSAALPTKAPQTANAYVWTGFYFGAHAGYAGGWSDWSTPAAGGTAITGSLDLFQSYNAFQDTGSYFAGVQAGYNYMLPNRVVVGAEADVSFSPFTSANGISIGGTSLLVSPIGGAETYTESMLPFGTVRGRIGYAPGKWLFYATGGLAWTYDQLTLTRLASGTTDMALLWRFGWAAGAGVEVAVAPHWTARVEYLFTDYGNESVLFANAGQTFRSDWAMQELRAGLNYQFGAAPASTSVSASTPDPDIVNFHGQSTLTWQGYPSFRSPYQGPNSLPGTSQGRETIDATLFAGVRLWQGGELWINPEIDQGFGLANTLGVAGFPSAEAYKVGAEYPYTRVQRYFIRQTINLGGDSQKVDAGLNQFAETQTADRVVITVGKFAPVDIFDNNKYAHDPRNDFLNWTVADTGTFDYAADAWAYTFGSAVEWYRGDWTFRGGLFDLSNTPNSPNLDPTFQQFQWEGEIERRYALWGHAGKIAVTGFLSRGRMGSFADAIALADITGEPADIAAVRTYQSRGGLSFNLEQEITSELGVFARAGVANGNIEPYEFTDVDRTVAAGLSLIGKQWGRPDDTVGFAGIVNGITKIHQEFLNDGGLGILVGDGMLPHPGPEGIIETYYSYALASTTKLTFDYQFIANPGYNEDRGPVNVFSTRLHWQY